MNGKDFTKLAQTAEDAAFEALAKRKMTHPADGGTCNFDKVAIPGGKRMLKKVEESGLDGYLRTSGMWKGYVLVSAPVFYQGYFNTVQVEAMAKVFKEGLGFLPGIEGTTVYYQMD
tara:strand:+ start:157 stop:504 length:348 start_codon:yes stop_codon:yes gene_type:complete